MDKKEIISKLKKIEHPAINYSLTKLGILREINFKKNNVSVVFAFPFPNIPIADALINSVADVVKENRLKFQYKTRVMTEKEREKFLQLETEAWRG